MLPPGPRRVGRCARTTNCSYGRTYRSNENQIRCEKHDVLRGFLIYNGISMPLSTTPPDISSFRHFSRVVGARFGVREARLSFLAFC